MITLIKNVFRNIKNVYDLFFEFFADDDNSSETGECWICYDSDAGPLIQPCDCRGDVGFVHHDCLRKWLMEVRIYFVFGSQ